MCTGDETPFFSFLFLYLPIFISKCSQTSTLSFFNCVCMSVLSRSLRHTRRPSRRLFDKTTTITSRCVVLDSPIPSSKVITGDSEYHQLLTEFPEITRPDGRAPEVNHYTQHLIDTTPGPPVANKPCRLAPDRLKMAKKQFDDMVQLGTARSSSIALGHRHLHVTQKRRRLAPLRGLPFP